MVPSQATRRFNSAIRATVSAALRPWSRLSPPARASACSIVSQVITPKAQGTPVAQLDVLDPPRRLGADEVEVGGLAADHDAEAGDPGEVAGLGEAASPRSGSS